MSHEAYRKELLHLLVPKRRIGQGDPAGNLTDATEKDHRGGRNQILTPDISPMKLETLLKERPAPECFGHLLSPFKD